MKNATILCTLLAAFLVGCYPTRWTTEYSDVQLLGEGDLSEDAVIEESAESEEEAKRIRERLEQIANEKESVYRMNAGDKIEIRVYGHDDIGTVTKLGPDGNVGIVFIGEIKLSGLTIAEAAEKISKGLEPYVKHPVVSVSVMEVDSEKATISGACKTPGVYSIENGTRLADFYAMAGSSAERLFNGVDVDVADLEHSLFVRNGEIIPVDFAKAILQADPLHNIIVRKGDYVYIAQRMESSIIVCGEIANPHKRLFESGMTLIGALTVSGWMLEDHWSHVIIIRNGLVHPKLYKINVDAILAGRSRDITLKPNDIIYVPRDILGEYNVFVRKLLPTAQLINLIRSRVSGHSS